MEASVEYLSTTLSKENIRNLIHSILPDCGRHARIRIVAEVMPLKMPQTSTAY